MNLISITPAKIDGNADTAPRLFNPQLMIDTRADAVVTSALRFKYPDGKGGLLDILTGALSLTSLANSINSMAPAGVQAYVGRINTTSGFSIATHDILDTQGNVITIPDNSRVWWGYYEVATAFTSATSAATISFSIETDGVAGLKAATAISTTAYNATGAPVLLIPQLSVATVSAKTTAARKLQYAVAVEALTAGDMEIFCLVVTGI